MLALKKSKTQPARRSLDRLQRVARERAEEQARHIPWQRLLETREQYIDWQEVYLWARSILEVEEEIPDWLTESLNDRCPGFLQAEKELPPKTAKNRALPLRLEDWIDEHIFGFAKEEGWFNAITYYAMRDPRYQRAEVCWSECVDKWKKIRPDRYPTFEEWKEMAEECDPTARLVPRERAAQACLRLVDPDRLREAVSCYIDWEAFAYWARPSLDRSRPLPTEVTQELNRRCPGFLSDSKERHDSKRGSEPWQQLMFWIADHFFLKAKNDCWLDAVLLEARMHPRSIRTMEFSDHCRHLWGHTLPSPYPAFDQWHRDADAYVEPGNLGRPSRAKSLGPR